LYQAAESGDLRQLQEALSGNPDVNVPDAKGHRALILAIQKGHFDAVKMLLAHGANANLPDLHGTTPMGAAYSRGSLEITNAVQRALQKH
jgi:ankyrin repeat protein